MSARQSNLRLFARSLRRHPGLHLCAIYPAFGLWSGLLGHADDNRMARGLTAAAAIAVLTLIPVCITAWTGRKQYAEPDPPAIVIEPTATGYIMHIHGEAIPFGFPNEAAKGPKP